MGDKPYIFSTKVPTYRGKVVALVHRNKDHHCDVISKVCQSDKEADAFIDGQIARILCDQIDQLVSARKKCLQPYPPSPEARDSITTLVMLARDWCNEPLDEYCFLIQSREQHFYNLLLGSETYHDGYWKKWIPRIMDFCRSIVEERRAA